MPGTTNSELIASTVTVLGSVTALCTTLFLSLKEYVKERSAGFSACARLRADIDQLKEEVAQGRNNDEVLQRLIGRLEEDYKFLTKRLFGMLDQRYKKD